tara:strand:+ start:1279 stop:2502 length:1224 start_codon:yes stop_codon:yes gene_type:complete
LSDQLKNSKVIITGATGFIGQILVPELVSAGLEVIVVGRDKARLTAAFPDLKSCTYDEMPKQGEDADLLVHLAVINNTSDVDSATFDAVNTDLTIKLAQQARDMNIRQFVNVSSLHALPDGPQTDYARSKRAAITKLEQMQLTFITTLFLPAVYGDRFAGKLAKLNNLPRPVARALFALLAAAKPTLHISRLTQTLINMIGQQNPATLILTDGQENNLIYRGIKRSLDLLFVVTIIGLLWWLLLGVWIAVKVGSAGPGIFAQERVGQFGKIFTCYKFRTMQQGTKHMGTHEVSAASVTKLGRILRKTKIDELPQIWNLLCNDMSLIGPRPGLPVQEQLFTARQSAGVFQVKPGISGLAQVNNIDMSDPDKLAVWDARYIALQSLVLDFKITIRTIRGGGQGDKIQRV